MQGNLSHFAHTRSNSVSLGNSHGYRFEGDTAILNAELAFAPAAAGGVDSTSQHWALQLWACESPHQGGPLRGVKVAEAELALASLGHEGQHEATRLETAAFAQLPPRQGEYAMVMVLASGDQGRYDQVHDFSNYAVRQQFSGPSLEGNVGYRFADDGVVLQAEAVRNARPADNLSGTLSLQLWALREPYQGGEVHGSLLAQASLGRLAGQDELRAIERHAPLAELAPGAWRLALLLREWTDAVGFVTRDYCNFSAPHHVEVSPRSAQPTPTVPDRALGEEPATSAAAADREPLIRATPVQVQPTIRVSSDDAAPTSAVAPRADTKIALKALSGTAAARPVAAERSAQGPSTKPLATQAPGVDRTVEATPAAALPAAKAAASAPRKARVSVQTATVEELASVDGLNKKLAQAIVKARPFATLDDVVRVRGIGDKLRDKLTV